jgi:hypothetical protein
MAGLSKEPAERPTLAELAAAFEAFSARVEAGEFDAGENATPSSGKYLTGGLAPRTTEEARLLGAGPQKEFEVGEMLGRFQIRGRLGRGGMGEVYRAWDSVLHRDVAIKVASKVEGEAAQKALLREARASSRLRSDNIVAVYDAGVHAGLPYVVMEFVEGRTLAEIVEDKGALVGPAFWRYAQGIVEGLAVAHESSPPVIHKDLKPANILVAGAVAKIADFGIANPLSASTKSDVSQVAAVMGSLGAMSPEQAEGRPTDARTDIYSLGATFYAMTTGTPPFVGNEIAQQYQLLTQPPEPPSKRHPGFAPPELERVILRCLEKDPERRYPTVRALRADLDAIFQPSTATVVRPWYRRASSLAGVLGIVVAALSTIAFLRTRGETRTFLIRAVGETRFDGAQSTRYTTSRAGVDLEYDARSDGELVVRVASADVGEFGPESRLRFDRTETGATLTVPLPAAPPDVGFVAYDVRVARADAPETTRTIRVVQDLRAPRVFVEAYGVRHDPAAGPVRVLAWRHAQLVVEDEAGLAGGGGASKRAELGERLREPWIELAPDGDPDADRRGFKATATDAAGRRAEVAVVLLRSTLALAPAPAPESSFPAGTFAWSAAAAPDPALPGFDAARDLADVRAALVPDAGAAGPRGTSVACAVRDGRLVAELPAPPAAATARLVVALSYREEALRTAVRTAGGDLRLGAPAYRLDPAPPRLEVVVDGATYAAPTPDGGASTVALRGPGAYRDRLAFRASDPDGVGPVRVEFAADDGAPELMAAGADGLFRPAVEPRDGARATVRAVDAAGNATTLAFVLSRRLQRATRVEIGAAVAPIPPGPGDDGRVFVNSAATTVAVFVEDPDEGEPLRVRVDGPGGPLGPAIPLVRRADGAFAAEIDLLTRGAPSCERTVAVLTADGGAFCSTPVLFDRRPPVVTVSRDGRDLPCGASLSAPGLPGLVFTVRDADSGLDAATVEAPVAVAGPARAVVDGAPAAGALEIVVRPAPLDVAPGPDGVRRYRFEARARDRAGNESDPCAVDVSALVEPVRLLSFAADGAYASGRSAPEERKAVRSTPIAVRVARDPTLSDYDAVAVTYAGGRTRETPLRLDDAATPEGREFLIDADLPADAGVVEGRTVFLLRERAPGARAGEPWHEVRWLLDRDAPRLVWRRGGVDLGVDAASRPVRVADAASVLLAVEDEGGFGADPVGGDDAADFEVVRPAPRRLELRLRDAGPFERRALRVVVRDAAGNETRSTLVLERARPAPSVEDVAFAGAAGAGPEGALINAPKVEYRIANDTVDAVAAQAVVRDASGAVVKQTEIARLTDPTTTIVVAWEAPAFAPYDVALFHFREGGGRAEEPFDVRRFTVDSTPPTIEAFVDGAPRAADAVQTPVETLEFVVRDAGAGVDPETVSTMVVGDGDGRLFAAPLLTDPNPTAPRYRMVVPGATIPVDVEFTIFDRAKNLAKAKGRLLPPPSSAQAPGPSNRARPLSDYAPAELASELEKVRAKSGVALALVTGEASRPLFYMAKTETTLGQYRRFVEAFRADPAGVGEALRTALRRPPPRLDEIEKFAKPGDADLPVLGVSEHAAAAFAAWIGGELPTYDEWRAAAGRARRPDAEFPLRADGSPGGSTDRAFASFGTLRLVTELDEGLFGLRGMAGNAAEWVVFGDGRRGVAGGSFKAVSSDYVELLRRPQPNFESDLPVRNAAGVRVKWPAER